MGRRLARPCRTCTCTCCPVAGDSDNDDIYREIEASGEREGERLGSERGDARDAQKESPRLEGRRFDPDAERVARSAAEMATEAAALRALFQSSPPDATAS